MTRQPRREAVREVEAAVRAAAARRAARAASVRRWVEAGARPGQRPEIIGGAGEGEPLELTAAQLALVTTLLADAAPALVVPTESRQEARAALLANGIIERDGDELRVARGASILAVEALAPRIVSVDLSRGGDPVPRTFRLAIAAKFQVLSVPSPSGGWVLTGLPARAGLDALATAVASALAQTDSADQAVVKATEGDRSIERRFTREGDAWIEQGGWSARLRRGGADRVVDSLRHLARHGVPSPHVTMLLGGDVEAPAPDELSRAATIGLGAPAEDAPLPEGAAARLRRQRAWWIGAFIAGGVALALGLSAEAIVLIPVAVAAVWLNYLFLSLDQGSDNRYLPKAWRGGPTPPESEGAEPAVSDAPGRASSGHDAAPGPSRPVDVARLTYGTPPTAERVVFAEAELSVLSANAAPTGATLPASRPLLGDAAEQRVLGLLEQRGVLHRVGDRVECANELVRAVLSTPEGIAFLQSPSDSAQFATPLGAVAAAAFRQRDIDGVEFVLVEALRDAPERLGSPR